MRKIIVDNEEWQWKVYKSTILVKDNEGKKFMTDIAKLYGVTYDEVERAAWKGNAYEITPKMIAEFIRSIPG